MVVSDLKVGENSFRSLAENLPGIVYRVLIEDDNRTIFFNDMVQTMTGYNPEDLKKGKVCSIDPLILPEDRLHVINIVKDAIEKNAPFEVEYRINNKSGELKWFFESGRPIRGHNGNPSYIDGVIFDISERKETEKKLKSSEETLKQMSKELEQRLGERVIGLRKSEKKFKTIFDESPIGIELYDSNGKLVDTNESCLDIFGVSSINDVRGFELFKDPNIPKEYLKKLKKGQVIRLEILFDFDLVKELNLYKTTKSGKIWIDLLISPLHLEENNTISNFLVQIQDITEKKIAEQKLKALNKELDNRVHERTKQLKKSEEQHNILSTELETILDHYPGLAFYKDTKNNFIRINQNVVDYYNSDSASVKANLTKEDIEGKNLSDLLPKVIAQAYWDDDLEVIKSGTPKLNIEKSYKTEHGIKWLNSNKIPYFNENGEIRGIIGFSIDITESKKAEQKIIQEREKANLYLNVVEVILVALDRDGKITLINKKGHELLGYNEGELIGKNWFEVCLPPHDRERVYEYFKKLMVGELKVVKFYENSVWTKNGEGRLISWSTVLFKDENENITGLLSSGVDITERAITEQKLIESEASYRYLSNELGVILDHLPGVVVYKDTENNILRVNKFLADAHNVKKTDMENRSSFDFYPRDVAQAYWEDDLEVINSKKPKINIVEPWETDAGKRWVNTSKIPYIDENGNVKGIIAIAFDVTERMLAEQKLKESEEKFRKQNVFLNNILKSLTHPFYVINVKDYKVVLANSAASSEGLVYGNHCYSLTHNRGTPCAAPCICPLDEVKKTKKTCVVEHTHYDKEGNEKIYEIYGYPILDENGNVVQMIEYALNITPRKIAQQALKKSEIKYRHLFENSPYYIILLDKNGNFIDCNNSTVDIYGFPKEDFSGKNFKEMPIIPPDIYPLLENIMKLLFKGEIPPPIEFKPITKDGKIIWINSQASLIKLDNEFFIYIIGQDITERKKTELKIKESEESYKALAHQWRTTFDAMSECVYLLDLECNIIQCNKATLEFLGKKDYDEIIGHSCCEIIHGTIEPVEWCPMARMIESSHKESSVVQIGDRYYEISLDPVINDEGTIIGAVHIIKDITERKKVERELIESEERFKTLFEVAPASIVYSDLNANILFCNKQFLKLHGIKRPEMINRTNITKFFSKQDLPKLKIELQKSIEGRAPGPTEYIMLKEDGTEFLAEASSIAVRDKNGITVGLIGVAQDITERKKAEQQLKESEEKFRTIAERTFMGILIIQDDRVKYANEALLRMFEYSQKDIVNWKMDDLTKLIDSDDLLFLREYREHLRSGDKNFKPYYSYKVFTKSGKIKWIDQFSKEMLYKGRLAELVTIMDITEKKEAEKELIKLNNMKSELLRRTSHELKTPLVSIKGFSDLLLELHRGKLDDYVIRTLEQIRTGCNRLESLVNDILKTAELESGTVALKKSKEDLSLLIKIGVNDLEGLSELRNHTINLEISDNLICSIEKEQVYNVITNILNNAIKFTPSNGKMEVKSEINNDFIIISIKDNGIGFTKEEKTQIFKQFGKIERYGQGYDVISEGSGLGLYISKKIIEMHGGEIWLESEGRDKGSTFYFSLPIN